MDNNKENQTKLHGYIAGFWTSFAFNILFIIIIGLLVLKLASVQYKKIPNLFSTMNY